MFGEQTEFVTHPSHGRIISHWLSVVNRWSLPFNVHVPMITWNGSTGAGDLEDCTKPQCLPSLMCFLHLNPTSEGQSLQIIKPGVFFLHDSFSSEVNKQPGRYDPLNSDTVEAKAKYQFLRMKILIYMYKEPSNLGV